MKTISSRDNPFYKELKLLASSSQARRKEGRTLLDGVHLCESYLQQIGKPLLCIVGETALKNSEVIQILRQCDDKTVQTIMLPDALFHALSQVENGIDILFMIDTPKPQQPVRLTQSAVLLDRVQDPGNFGSIVRSAAAAGVQQIFCSAGTTFAWSPKVLRAGMGAHFLLQIFEHVDLSGLLRNADIPVIATSSHAEQQLYDLDLKRPVAWLFGHEGQGVADDLLAQATYRVTIPHLGAIESLNVAASSAVCFFEQVRQQVKG
ncbi:MAG TPA: RNA methyltransferase [Oxalicibacterium sp.]|uniref:TrmH family RNA methyltransferase n=1 Tax=Oxalicibacterium sp. TaxID=2766525 RepID=UPI002B6DDB97|nr:RNA methyltransferase [Oxalicibacterium sp.]HWU99142.1 RNA methyltransferase [Oxalicibacterium sp.]